MSNGFDQPGKYTFEGPVGIKIDPPSADLDVDGNIKAKRLDVTGQVVAGSFSGNGSALTGIKLEGGSVGSNQLADGVVTSAKIADNSITTPKIVNGAITSDKLDPSISFGIPNGGVGTAQLADNAVTTPKIADNAVTAAKIQNGAITRDKLDSSIPLGGLADGAVTTPKIADNAVTTPKIADRNITTAKLANGAVTTNQIADNSITAAKIQNGAITREKLDPSIPIGGTGSSQWSNVSNGIYYNGGSVGIGTDNPLSKLQVANGAIMPSVGNSETAGIMFPKDPGGGSGDAAWMRYYPRTGEATTLEIGISDNPDDHIYLNPSGGVGIGTNTPTQKLDVNGTVKATKFQGDGSELTGIKFPPSSSQWKNGQAGVSIFYNDGNVGIGTADPKAKLQVANGAIMPSVGNSETAGIMFPKDPFGGDGDAAWIRYYARTGEATTLEIGISNDPDDHIALMPNAGNVGINTTTPKSLLEIRKDVGGKLGPVLTLQNGSGGAGAGAAIDFNVYDVGQNPSTARIQSIDDGNFSSHIAFYTKDLGNRTNQLKERLRVQSNGNVGIGTQNPEALLHVFSPDQTYGGNIKFFPTSGKGLDFAYDGGQDGLFGFTSYGKEDGETRFQWVSPNGDFRGLLFITNRGEVRGRLVNTSSKELKENITDFSTQEAIETLAGLNPVKFNYRTDKEKEPVVGFIAEDVPELVATAERKGVCAMEIVAVLTKVIQQQQQELSCLKERLNAIEASV